MRSSSTLLDAADCVARSPRSRSVTPRASTPRLAPAPSRVRPAFESLADRAQTSPASQRPTRLRRSPRSTYGPTRAPSTTASSKWSNTCVCGVQSVPDPRSCRTTTSSRCRMYSWIVVSRPHFGSRPRKARHWLLCTGHAALQTSATAHGRMTDRRQAMLWKRATWQ